MKETNEPNELMRIMLDVNPHINILFDSSFNIIDCNMAAVHFWGLNSKEELLSVFNEILKKSIPDFQPDGRKSESLVDKLSAAVKEAAVRFETIIYINNEIRSLDVEFKKIPYGKSYAIVGFVYDMTLIREHEMNLVRTQAMNELQLTKLNAVVKATKIGLWDVVIVNNDPVNPANIFRWSDEFRYMLGYSNKIDFPDTFEIWNDHLHPDEREEVHRAVMDHMSDKTGKTPYDVEYRMLHKNGEYRYFHVCGETIRDKNGNAMHTAGAIMDITKSKEFLLNTEKQRIEAEAASKAKSIFLSSMSHEIRTPLNAIIGMTTIGRMSSNIEKKDSAFNKIDGASRHLLGVINDILDMSKIEANKLELSLVNFEFKKSLQNAVEIVSLRINERKQNFKFSIEDDIPNTLIGDDQRLTQVVTNLLSNAVKFTPDGGSIHLASRLVSNENDVCRVEISVSDNGIGISDEQKNRLFESFEQADAGTSRKFGGTGLGLSISKRIIELMNGNIWVESQPGEGSKFIFTVLLKRGSQTEMNSADSALMDKYNGSRYGEKDFSGKTILLAEDIEINREIIITLLEPMKPVIEYADNGEKAVSMFTKSPDKYDLIMMDIQMPVMDGYEATIAIRAFEAEKIKNNKELQKRQKGVPIIAMTANVFNEDIEKCIESGMNSHIGKPIDFNEMMEKLRQYLL